MKKRYLVIPVLVFLLIMVRAMEHHLFYDPLIDFFEGDYYKKAFPKIDFLTYGFHLFFRFTLNTLFSLGIIYTFFLNRNYTQFAAVFYAGVFVLATAAFYALLMGYDPQDHLLELFYIRRVLIQPLFLFVLFPGLYYQDLVQKRAVR